MTSKIWESQEEAAGEKSAAEQRPSAIHDEESSLGEDEKAAVKANADDRTTGSFLHAVINMVGMLIGKFTIFMTPLLFINFYTLA